MTEIIGGANLDVPGVVGAGHEREEVAVNDPVARDSVMVTEATPPRKTLLEIGYAIAAELGIEPPIAREAVLMSETALKTVPDVERTDAERERCLKAYWLGYYQTLQDKSPTPRTALKIRQLRADLGLAS